MKQTLLLSFLTILCCKILSAQCTEGSLVNNGIIVSQPNLARQSFTASCNGTLASVTWNITTSAGAPSGTPLTVSISNFGGGVCAPGTVIATSNATNVVPSLSGSPHVFTFPTPPTITQGTQYILHINGGSPAMLTFGQDSYAGGQSSQTPTTSCLINSFDYEVIANIVSTPTPIELISFTVEAINNKFVQLHWQTASETNNDYYTIEKSKDGVNWKEVTTLDGAGASTSSHVYSAKDQQPYNGLSYYRLRQTDTDRKFTFSDIKQVRLDMKQVIRIHPNPTSHELTITSNELNIKDISVYNSLGQQLINRIQLEQLNVHEVKLTLNEIPEGVYFLKIGNQIMRFVKY